MNNQKLSTIQTLQLKWMVTQKMTNFPFYFRRMDKSTRTLAGFPSKVMNLTHAQNIAKTFASKHSFHPTSQREQNRLFLVNWH